MFKGWKLVARLGQSKGKYPHILVDPYNWCLRLGPKKSRDDKFYSSLPSLLKGLLEHLTRRRMLTTPVLDSLQAIRKEVRSALRSALGAVSTAGRDLENEGYLKRDTLTVGAPHRRSPIRGTPHRGWTPEIIQGGG